MSKLTRSIAAALVAAAFATPALADSGNFPYVALDIGQTKATDACSTAGAPAGTTFSGCKDSAAGIRVSLGTEVAPNFSAEVGYGSYGSATLGSATRAGTTANLGNWKLSGFQLAGIGALPVSDTFSVTGKIGLASTKLALDVGGLSATSTNLMWGLGVKFKVNSDVAVRAQYENLGTVGDTNTTGTAKVSVLSVGVVYQF